MRYLVFTKDDETAFDMLMQGIHLTRRSFTGPETRVVAKILDKVEAIATSTDALDDNGKRTTTFKMKPEGGMISLEDAEFNLVKEAVDQTPWNARGARKVVLLFDILDKAPNKEPEVDGAIAGHIGSGIGDGTPQA